MEDGPSGTATSAAAGIGTFNSGLAGFLGRLGESISSGISAATGSLTDFSEGIRETTTPILSAVHDLSRTAEAFGYMGMAFDPTNRSGIARVIDGSRAVAEGSMRYQTTIGEAIDRVQESAQGLEDFDASKAGQSAYLRYKEKQKEQRKKKNKERSSRKAPSGSWSDRRRRYGSRRR